MNVTDHSRKSVLVLTHNYPRFPGDVSGVFLRNLLQSLDGSSRFTVLVPHDKGLDEEDRDQTRKLLRFRYGSDESETLAYRGEMHHAIKSRPVSVLRFFQSYRKAAIRESAGETYDLIWAHWWIPGGWAGSKASHKSGTPLLLTCHGTDIFLLSKFPMIRSLGSGVFARADHITVVSSYLKDQLVSSMGDRVPGLGDKVEVIPMPVSEEAFSYDEGVTPRKGSIISASRLTSQKHLDKLLQAAAKLKVDKLEFSIDLFGDGPEKANLSAMIRDLGLSSEVKIHDPVSQTELADKYRRSEIAVLVSEREGFGLMLPEAMMCGCAAVGAKSGGITDIIGEDGIDGLFVEPGDADSLYIVLKRLISERDVLERLSKSCRVSASRRFSEASIAARFSELIRTTASS